MDSALILEFDYPDIQAGTEIWGHMFEWPLYEPAHHPNDDSKEEAKMTDIDIERKKDNKF